jgi:hypothetical protein
MPNPLASYLPGAAALQIGLAPDGIVLLKTRGLLRRKTTLVAQCALDASSIEAASTQLRGMLADAKCTNLPVSIVVADQWSRTFMVNPPQNADSMQDCKAAAAMRFQQLYGEPPGNWELRADWQVQHAFLACALPSALMTALQKIAREFRLTLLSVVPQFIATWNQCRNSMKPGAWFGLVQNNLLTLAPIDQNRLCAIRSAALPPGAWQDAKWLTAHLTREAMLLNVPMPKQVQLCGPLPQHSSSQSASTPAYTQLGMTPAVAGCNPDSAAARMAFAGGAS